MTARPMHLIPAVAAARTLCGIDADTIEALPQLGIRHLPGHYEAAARTGRPFNVCPECQRRHANKLAGTPS